jgi:hypothetical protein
MLPKLDLTTARRPRVFTFQSLQEGKKRRAEERETHQYGGCFQWQAVGSGRYFNFNLLSRVFDLPGL